MGITYESICQKLGFDPVKGEYPQNNEKKIHVLLMILKDLHMLLFHLMNWIF